MPISAPSPNCAPSVNDVGALTYTQAASTSRVNRRAWSAFSVIMDSLCPEPNRAMWDMASSTPATVLTAME